MAERITAVEVNLQNLKETVYETDRRNCKEHAEIKKIMLDFIDSADKKFASKNVEKFVYGAIALSMTAVGGGLLSLILK